MFTHGRNRGWVSSPTIYVYGYASVGYLSTYVADIYHYKKIEFRKLIDGTIIGPTVILESMDIRGVIKAKGSKNFGIDVGFTITD